MRLFAENVCHMRKQSMQLGALLINCPMMKLPQKSTLAIGAITKSSLSKVSLEIKSEEGAGRSYTLNG
jgi:hypothetical protein